MIVRYDSLSDMAQIVIEAEVQACKVYAKSLVEISLS